MTTIVRQFDEFLHGRGLFALDARASNRIGILIVFVVLFGIASVSGLTIVRRYYAPLIKKSRLHRRMLMVWLVSYCFVGIQMSWVLRPFIGDPRQPVAFFRSGAWGNAYVVLANLITSSFKDAFSSTY